MRIAKLKKIFIFFFFASQILIWIGGHSWLMAKGFSLGEKEREITLIKEENEQLEKKVAVLSSLETIEKKAIAFGFSPIKRIVVLNWSQPMAFRSQ